MATSFDWQSVLAKGRPPGGGSLIITDRRTPITPEQQAALDYNKALRYQSSAQRQQEAMQSFGATDPSQMYATPAGYVPYNAAAIPAPGSNATGVVGGSATGTPNVVAPPPPPPAQPARVVAPPAPSPMPVAAPPAVGQVGAAGRPPGEPTLPQGYTPNPYLNGIAADVTQQVNKNLFQTTLPNIRSSSIVAGGYGDNRSSILEGQAAGEAARGLAGSLAGMYGNDFQQSQQRNLQQYGMDQGFWLGRENLDRQIFNDNMGWSNLSQKNNLDLMAMLFGMNKQGANAGQEMDQTQTGFMRDMAAILAPMLNAGSTAKTNFDTSPFLGAAGGAQLFNTLFGGR